MKKLSILFLSCLLALSSAKADEGMWLLPSISSNIQKMQQLGLKMSAEEIYSNSQSSLKDAIVIFGGGCTGVAVSPNGLIFTNHHCGYNVIQQHSTVEHNYLKDGFVAKTLKDEIPSPGLAVTFLVKTENVTDRVLSHLANLKGDERSQALDSLKKVIEKEAKGDTHYIAQVRSFFAGNEYYLFLYEKFTDVRFVFAPPSSIGKFGGETDNWMYPRHTGDFSEFRVYCGPDGKPADYSENNVPYKPKHYVPISLKGYKAGDYSMILGNPGSTERYATSFAIKERVKNGNSARIEMRGVKQNSWKKFMLADEAINIAYANKYAGSSNYWKNSIGMNKAIAKLKVVAEKEKQEREFQRWADSDSKRKAEYGKVLSNLKKNFEAIDANKHSLSYLREALISGMELPRIADIATALVKKDKAKANEKVAKLYKDYYPEVDKATMVELLKAYRNAVAPEALPEFYNKIDKKFKGSEERFVDYMFKKSAFVTFEKFKKAAAKRKPKFEKDPAVIFNNQVFDTYYSLLTEEYRKNNEEIYENETIYLKGLKEMAAEQGKPLYPDANFTMRLTYGSVKGYSPADAVENRYYTTTQGILEKEDNTNPEFVVPAKLKQSILNRDFGRYADKDSKEMHVAFISNNDITGGNSGSPVFNGNGELIGLAFDGNWEAMSGDIIFEKNLQRCINVDIRYVLYVMDKIGGAERLIKELTIVE